MAKTIRRRKAKFNYSAYVLCDLVRVPGEYRSEWVSIDRHSDEGRRKLARYHSDAGFGAYGHGCAPHWYRRLRNKKAAAVERQYLHRWKKLGDEQYEVPWPARVNDASWYW